MLTVAAGVCGSGNAEGGSGGNKDEVEIHVRGKAVLTWSGGRCCRRGSSSGRVRGRPRPRFSSRTNSEVDTDDVDGERGPMYWRFLMPFVWFFAEERIFVFWTWAARAASLNALGAVAGVAIMVIPLFFGVRFFVADFVTAIVDKDDMIGATAGDDGEAVAGKNSWRLDRLVGLGPGPKRDIVDVSDVLAASAGVVLTAAFGGWGTI